MITITIVLRKYEVCAENPLPFGTNDICSFCEREMPSSVCVHRPFWWELRKEQRPLAAFGDRQHPGGPVGGRRGGPGSPNHSPLLHWWNGRGPFPSFPPNLTWISALVSACWSLYGCSVDICISAGLTKCTRGPRACRLGPRVSIVFAVL